MLSPITNTPTKEAFDFSSQLEKVKEAYLSQRKDHKQIQQNYNLSKESIKQMVAKRQRQQRIQSINIVNINNTEHQEIVIQILQDKNKTTKDITFLKKALADLPLFQKNPELLNKSNITQLLLNEFSYEKFNKHDIIFNFGDFGYTYYIVLKGAVYLMIPKLTKDDNRTEKEKANKKINTKPKEDANIGMSNASISSQVGSKSKISDSNPSSMRLVYNQSQQDGQIYETNGGSKWSIIKDNIRNIKNTSIIHQNSIEDQSKREIENQEVEDADDAQEDEGDYLKRVFDDMNLIKTFIAGEAFGEIALMTKQRRTGTMVCKEETHLMTLTKNGFDKILGQYHEHIKTERLGFLKSYSFLNTIPNSNLLSIMLDIKIDVYPKKAFLFAQGEEVKNIYFIKRGEVQLSRNIQESTNVQEDESEIIDSPLPGKKKILTIDDLFKKYHNRSRQRTYKQSTKQILISSQGSQSHLGCEDLVAHIMNNLQNNNLSRFIFFHSYSAEVISQEAEIYRLNKESIENFAEQLKEKVLYFDQRLGKVLKAQEDTEKSMKTLIKKIDSKKNKDDLDHNKFESKSSINQSFQSYMDQTLNSPNSKLNLSINSPILQNNNNKLPPFQDSIDQDFLLEDNNMSQDQLSKSNEEKSRFFRDCSGFRLDNDISPSYIHSLRLNKKKQISQFLQEPGLSIQTGKRPSSNLQHQPHQNRIHSGELTPYSSSNAQNNSIHNLRLKQVSVQANRSQYMVKEGLAYEFNIPNFKYPTSSSPLKLVSPIKKLNANMNYLGDQQQIGQSNNTFFNEELQLQQQQHRSSLLLPEIELREKSTSKRMDSHEKSLNNSCSMMDIKSKNQIQSQVFGNNNLSKVNINRLSSNNSILPFLSKHRLSEAKMVDSSPQNQIASKPTSGMPSQLVLKDQITRSKSSLTFNLQFHQISKSMLPDFQQSLVQLQKRNTSQHELTASSLYQTDRSLAQQQTDRMTKTAKYSLSSSNGNPRELLLIDELEAHQMLPQKTLQSKRESLQRYGGGDFTDTEEQLTQTLRKQDQIPLEIKQIIETDSSLIRSQRATKLLQGQSKQKFKLNFEEELKLKTKLLKKTLHQQQAEQRNQNSIFPAKEVDNIKDLNIDLFGKPSKYHSVILMQQLMQMELRNNVSKSTGNNSTRNQVQKSPSNQSEEQRSNINERDIQYQNYKQSTQIPVHSNRVQTNLLKYFQEKLNKNKSPTNIAQIAENNTAILSPINQTHQDQPDTSPINLKAIFLQKKTDREKRNLKELDFMQIERNYQQILPLINLNSSAPDFGEETDRNLSFLQMVNKVGTKPKQSDIQECINIHTQKMKKNKNHHHNGLAKMQPNNICNVNSSRRKQIPFKQQNQQENSKLSHTNSTPLLNFSHIK